MFADTLRFNEKKTRNFIYYLKKNGKLLKTQTKNRNHKKLSTF